MKRLNITYFDEVYALMEEAFPIEERRSFENQKALLERDDYAIYGVLEQDHVVAFIAAYVVSDVCFIEHLAVRREARGTGIGKELLQAYLKHTQGLVVLEVEKPAVEIARRRIAFYERLGFTLFETNYAQPPLHGDLAPLPLYLMSWPRRYDDQEWEKIIINLYRDVYHWQQPI